jgi:thiol-disulfide isomerase/thioredoxin
MPRLIRIALVGALAAAGARAQGSPDDPQLAARTAFAEAQAALAEARSAVRDNARRRETFEAHRAAQERFRAAFARSDWDKWDPQADKDLLFRGLASIGDEALDAGDAETAVRAFTALVAKFPESKGLFTRRLASAHIRASGFEQALAFVRKSVEAADQTWRPDVLVLLGDYRAAAGDGDGARRDWQAASDAVPDAPDPRADPRGRAKADAGLRLALVGNEAPDIAAATWLDSECRSLSALQGNVVIVDFWATWCPPCRGIMPALDALHRERKQAGLVVLGVTRFYERGFLPKPGTKDPVRDGEAVSGITRETFLGHVRQFKSNLGLAYPFAIATDAEFKTYRVSRIPMLVVVGRDGRVAFVKDGGGDETLLNVAVERQLAREGATGRG